MLDFWVKKDSENKQAQKLMEQWSERLESYISRLPAEIAEKVHSDVVKMAPSDIPKYPDMLKVVEFPRQGEWQITGVVPPGWNFSQRLKTSDVQRTLIYVLPKMRGGETVSEGAVVLSRSNPWTMQTLPYEPTRQEASLRSRRVDARDVKAVEKERESEKRTVIQELRRLGVPIRAEGKVLLERRVSRDLAFEILRREKGIGGPGHAHWRPAVQAVYTQHVKNVLEEMGRWMSDPENSEWKDTRNLPVEAVSVMKRLQEFQDRIVPGGI